MLLKVGGKLIKTNEDKWEIIREEEISDNLSFWFMNK